MVRPAHALLLVGAVALSACGRSSPVKARSTPPPQPVPQCALTVTPDSLDFGEVDPDAPDSPHSVTVHNGGTAACDVTSLAPLLLAEEFFVEAPTEGFRIEPGMDVVVSVRFLPWPPFWPLERTGQVVLETTDPARPELKVSAKAVLARCVAVTPSQLDFGNVPLFTSQTSHVAITNEGNRPCAVSQVNLRYTSDVLFSLPAQPTLFDVAPGATATVAVTFTASDSAPPHERTGTLDLSIGDRRFARRIPLSAYISTVCTQAGQYIYTVDANGRFSRFDPKTLTFFDLGLLRCPTTSSPFSMNVDQSGTAWVLFSDQHLYTVDTATAACSPTAYVPGQQGFTTFGMGSVFDAHTGDDTLYLSGTSSKLGTLSLGTLAVARKGTLRLGYPELAGTGDGQLWAFEPIVSGSSTQAELDRVDPITGATLETYDLSAITSIGGFAIRFFGGAFFIFVGEDVWKLERSALDPRFPTPRTPPLRVLQSPGRNIVGAGVSTCAPVH